MSLMKLRSGPCVFALLADNEDREDVSSREIPLFRIRFHIVLHFCFYVIIFVNKRNLFSILRQV